MKRELGHFMIGRSYGGSQEWFRSFMMRIGGCGAETACDSSLYFALHRGVENIYPFDLQDISRKDYVEFAHIMERYLWPRMSGIHRPEIFINGYTKYLEDRGVDCIEMDIFRGSEPYDKAAETVRRQIDSGYPLPTLVLNHRDRTYRDYVWHWFLINGYEETEETLLVKAVTYSEYKWLDLRRLWNTGYANKGGFVLFSLTGNE